MEDRANRGSADAPWEDGGEHSGRVVVGGRSDDILRGDTEDYLIDGRGGVDTARVELASTSHPSKLESLE